MVFRRLDAELTLDTAPYSAGLHTASVELRTFTAAAANAGREANAGMESAAVGAKTYAATVAETSLANVAARVKEGETLIALRAQYASIAAAATTGSAEQVAASRLVLDANRKLIASGLEVEAVNERAAAAAAKSSTFSASAAAGRAGVTPVGTGAGAIAAPAVGLVLLRSIEEASDLNETISKSEQVFGAAAAGVERFGDTADRKLGQSKQAAIEATATFGNLFRGIGASQPEAAEMSMALVKLSADLASFNNLDPSDVLQDLRSGIVGEAEPLRKYGVLLNEATVKAKAYELGLASAGAELTEQEKVQARYAIILEQTVRAQGDFARTADGLANQTRTAKASVHDLGSDLGNVLLPATVGVVRGLNTLNDVLERLPGQDGKGGIFQKLYDFGPAGPALRLLGELGGKHKDVSDAARGQAQAEQEAQAATIAATQASAAHGAKMQENAALVGLSADSMASAIGIWATGSEADFARAETAAKSFASAVQQGVNASSAAFLRTTDAVSHFSASSLDAAARAATKSAGSIEKDDTRVADSIQRVADLQEQFAEKAAADSEAYADKVTETDERLTRALDSYAETVESTNERIADADQKLADDRISSAQSVADAEKRLNDDRLEGQRSVAEAEQRLDDEQRLQALKRNPAAQQRLRNQMALRDAEMAIVKAKESADDKEQSNLDAVARAKQNQIRILAKDQEDADRARIDGAKAVEKAEAAVTHAREEQAKLAEEGLHLGELTLAQQRQMRDAVLAVSRAHDAAADSAITSTAEVAGAIEVTTADVKKFYEDSLAEGKTFSEGIKTAIEKGYDPGFISRLLQQGPREAAPILRAIVSDQDNSLRDLVNASERAIDDMNTHVREVARLTFLATHSTTDQMNLDFSKAMGILEATAGTGAERTADTIARKLGIGVGEVERIAKEYGITLAAGINPVLEGIGAPVVQVAGGREYGADRPGIQMALGGLLPGHGGGDRIPLLAEGGEYIFSVAAVDAIGPDKLEDLHQRARKGYAAGGFVTAGDVPWPPDLRMYGDKVGYAGTKVNQHAYDKVVEYLNGGGGAGAGTLGTGQIGTGWRAITNYLDSVGQDYQVTSTLRPGSITSSGNLSNHALGKAVDLVGDMPSIFNTLLNVAGTLSELFYDPIGWSIKNGQRADWTVGGHDDHVHAATFHDGGLVDPLHVGVMDRGGWLEPGWNLNYNGLGVREPVGAMAAAAAGAGGDVNIYLTIDGALVGPTKEHIAQWLAEPLRAIALRQSRANTGGYLG